MLVNTDKLDKTGMDFFFFFNQSTKDQRPTSDRQNGSCQRSTSDGIPRVLLLPDVDQ